MFLFVQIFILLITHAFFVYFFEITLPKIFSPKEAPQMLKATPEGEL